MASINDTGKAIAGTTTRVDHVPVSTKRVPGVVELLEYCKILKIDPVIEPGMKKKLMIFRKDL